MQWKPTNYGRNSYSLLALVLVMDGGS